MSEVKGFAVFVTSWEQRKVLSCVWGKYRMSKDHIHGCWV